MNDDKIEVGRARARTNTVHANSSGHRCVRDEQDVVLLLAVGRKKTLNSLEYAMNQAQYFFKKKRKLFLM